MESYGFLECAGISNDLRTQCVAAAGGSYDYERLRSALVAIVPTVKRDDENPASASKGGKPGPRHVSRDHQLKENKTCGVHAVGGNLEAVDEGEPGEEEEREKYEDEEALMMEQEAEVLLTQAAKRRSQAERARGFQRVESAGDREARIESLKAKMACSACLPSTRQDRIWKWAQRQGVPLQHGSQEGKEGICGGRGRRRR